METHVLSNNTFVPRKGGVCFINELPPETLSHIFELGSMDDGFEKNKTKRAGMSPTQISSTQRRPVKKIPVPAMPRSCIPPMTPDPLLPLFHSHSSFHMSASTGATSHSRHHLSGRLL
ncbi:hypothetical protein JVT61DRAFT_11862 [Boletus reticuloceps]|uniref:Uncharacterized protein n=1 Tax=Boletus reticuloceps TaxID=495285 RepID=A0A8I2YWM8_9AGAM|nr:hypothetical protein JVT61DRAFT_11862 [Boletus reticuloceps]